ncbi:MAG: M18 family aminopeptidase [Pseudomonadales bacterium]
MPENKESQQEFNQRLLSFIQSSPTPFHAVRTMQQQLLDAGFEPLAEEHVWKLRSGGKYFVTRNDSSLIAFTFSEDILQTGISMVGAHTDSPCLKVKPNADVVRHGYHQLGLEVYGGVLLNPWFDRDLSIAGRVSYAHAEKGLRHALLDFEQAIGIIPSLAIHLDRGVNEQRSIDKQTDLPVVLALAGSVEECTPFKSLLAARLKSDGIVDSEVRVLDYEMCLYDTQPPAVIGMNQDFIAAARLDNLLSCFVGLEALLAASEDDDGSRLLVCTDHEEVGSASAAGASGPMLRDCLVRMCGSEENLIRTMQQSMMISADNAHGVHPNYASKHDSNHGPVLNQGTVIKINSNQRYATNSETAARFRLYAEKAGVSVQSFVVRSDMGCGSTIGPIAASELGVPTVDVGVPTFAMHSIRELAGSDDAWQLSRILGCFYRDNA